MIRHNVYTVYGCVDYLCAYVMWIVHIYVNY